MPTEVINKPKLPTGFASAIAPTDPINSNDDLKAAPTLAKSAEADALMAPAIREPDSLRRDNNIRVTNDPILLATLPPLPARVCNNVDTSDT